MPITLPKPTGNYTVGRRSLHLIDAKRPEPHLNDEKIKRELMLTAWYPSMNLDGASPAPFPADDIATYIAAIEGVNVSELSFLYELQTHSFENAQVSTDGPFPVVVLSSGFGSPRGMYTSLAEELASNGYVVLGTGHPYSTISVAFPDGRKIGIDSRYLENGGSLEQIKPYLDFAAKVWADDIRFVLRELLQLNTKGFFKRTLDLENIGIVGHSFGGSTVMHTLAQNSSLKAGINIDGKLFGVKISEPINTPLLLMHPDRSDGNVPWYTPSNAECEELAALGTNATYQALFKTADHESFSDYYLLRPHACTEGILAPQKASSITRALVLDFLNTNLKGHKSETLDESSLLDEVALSKNV